MTLSERLSEYVRAAFSGIWVQTHEQDDALHEIAQLARQNNWRLASWDIDKGLKLDGTESDAVPSANDPLSAIRSLNALATPDGTAIVVLRSFHRFLGSAEIVQALDTAISRGKQERTFVMVLSPVVQIPVELERQLVVVEHDLPGRDQLEQIARSIATEPGDLPEDDDLGLVLDAAAGLTRMEAENAFSLSLVRHGKVVPETPWELKTGMLKKSGLLTLHQGGETFADLGGLESLKAFSKKALGGRRGSGVQAKGVLLRSRSRPEGDNSTAGSKLWPRSEAPQRLADTSVDQTEARNAPALGTAQ
jgi:hypothetical protein